MDIVIDASVLLAVLTSEPERKKLIALTKKVDLVAPISVHWEIGNALSAMLKKQRLNLQQALSILSAYEKIPIRNVEVSIREAVKIASEQKIYAYDAYLIVCARKLGVGLLSLYKGLLKAAQQYGVAIMEVQ